MPRWTSFVGAVMLVLMLWTGGVAHAAERFDCIPATTEAAGHFDGDKDQSSSDRGQVAHHHSGCNGHQLGTPTRGSELIIAYTAAVVPFVWREAGVPGHSPDNLLRPPIA